MLDQNDIQVITDLLSKQDEKTAAMFAEVNQKMDERFAEAERRTDERFADVYRKMDERFEAAEKRTQEMMDRQTTSIMAYIEGYFEPQIQMLADGHKLIVETMTPKSEIEDMKVEISILRDAMKYLSAEVEALKSKVS